MKNFMTAFIPLFTLFSTGYACYQTILDPTVSMVIITIVFAALIAPAINILKESK